MTPQLTKKMEAALKAVRELFADQSGSVAENKDALENVRDLAQSYVDVCDADIKARWEKP